MEFENRLNNFRTFVTMVTQDGAGEISSLYILILRDVPLCLSFTEAHGMREGIRCGRSLLQTHWEKALL